MSGIILLDVGGTTFKTSLSTLTKYNWFKSNITKEISTFFIDRDPTWFRYILNFLRDGDIDLPQNIATCREILREAKFYTIDDLVSLIEKRLEEEDDTSQLTLPINTSPLLARGSRSMSVQDMSPIQQAHAESRRTDPTNQKQKEVNGNDAKKGRDKGEIAELLKMLNNSNKLRAAMEAEIKSLKEIVQTQKIQSENETNSLKNELDNLKKQLDSKFQEVATLSQQKLRLQEELKKLDEDFDILNSAMKTNTLKQTQEMELLRSQNEEDKKFYSNQNKLLEVELEDLKEQLDEKEQKLKQLQSSTKNEQTYLREQLNSKSAQLESLEIKYAKLKKDKKKWKSEAKKYKERARSESVANDNRFSLDISSSRSSLSVSEDGTPLI